MKSAFLTIVLAATTALAGVAAVPEVMTRGVDGTTSEIMRN